MRVGGETVVAVRVDAEEVGGGSEAAVQSQTHYKPHSRAHTKPNTQNTQHTKHNNWQRHDRQPQGRHAHALGARVGDRRVQRLLDALRRVDARRRRLFQLPALSARV